MNEKAVERLLRLTHDIQGYQITSICTGTADDQHKQHEPHSQIHYTCQIN